MNFTSINATMGDLMLMSNMQKLNKIEDINMNKI